MLLNSEHAVELPAGVTAVELPAGVTAVINGNEQQWLELESAACQYEENLLPVSMKRICQYEENLLPPFYDTLRICCHRFIICCHRFMTR